jgi:cytidylate kinase
MNTPFGFERSLSFIHCQLKPTDKSVSFQRSGAPKHAVTISRQSGCGAHVVGEKLIRYLQSRTSDDEPPWTLLDRNLVEKVLQDHQMPERLARFMPEDRTHEISDIMEHCIGLHPPSELLIQRMSETIRRLAEAGNVIIVGRAASVITANLPHVIHVRLVGSVEKRAEHMQQREGIGKREALDRIHNEDLGRERYIKKHFGRNIDDALLYHLTINTDVVSLDDAAHMIGDLVLHRVPAAAA